MELQLNIILLLIFLSGISITAAVVTFTIGIKTKNRIYWCFGVISFLSSCYYGLAVFSTSNPNPIISTLALISFLLTFALLPWFIKEYFNLKNKLYPTISSTLLIAAILTFIIQAILSNESSLWEIIAHLGVFVYIFHTYHVAITNKENLSTKKRIILGAVITLMFLFLCDNLIAMHAPNIRFWADNNWPLPIDYYLFAFLLIIGSNLIADLKRKEFLEKEIITKAHQWDDLINNVQMLAIKLDKEYQVIGINPFFTKKTGYQMDDLKSKEWYKKVYPEEDLKIKSKVYENISPENNYSNYNGKIITKQGETLDIHWSMVAQHNQDNEFSGVIAIGEDITQRIINFKEIKQLKNQLEKENFLLKEKLHININDPQLISKSHASIYAHEKAMEVAPTQSIVLLEGETGVGKEIFARIIHDNSKRKDENFVKINCSAIPSDLIESELFGHEKGAFANANKSRKGIFEQANNGTLFLDEIGELPLNLQPKLLRVLQDGEFQKLGGEKTNKVDVRIIAATNKILTEEIGRGNFRKDLYFRLNVFPITIPPLRKRKEDIPLFIAHFVQRYSTKYEKTINKVSKHTYESFQNHHWPGNIRELKNVIERAVILAKTDTLKTNGLLQDTNQVIDATKIKNYSLQEIEKQHIIKVLKESNWQIHGESGAAQKLEINPNTLRSRIKKLQIEKGTN